MATLPSQAEIEAAIAAIRARRTDVLTKPLKHGTGRSNYDNSGLLKELAAEESRLLAQLRAVKRVAGRIGPARRELW
jgi:hypothetical protein